LKPRSFTVELLVFVTVITPDAAASSTLAYNASGIGDTVKFDTIRPFPYKLTV
jgi:hypothetical protein